MISIVICSINKALAAQVKRNIDKTIGVPWELILLDNTVLKKGITEVYNLGARQAKFDILCFVHEDVLFRTDNWGRKITGYFENDANLGLVGVAGAKYKSKTLSGWSTGLKEFDCCNILHLDKDGIQQRIYFNPDNEKTLTNTITIDGVFMCVRKSSWAGVRFNEKLLKGFHLYDIDFSFSVSAKHKVAVTYEIDIVHHTIGGDFGNAWINDTIKWHRYYSNNLPAEIKKIPSDLNLKIERKIKKNWLHRLKGEKISLKNKIRWIVGTKAYVNFSLWPHIVLFLLFRAYKKVVS